MNFDWAIYIYQAGLGLQLLSFLIFTGIYLRFLLHVARDTELWTRDAARGKLSDWRYLAAALVISCITIIVSIFPPHSRSRQLTERNALCYCY